MHARNPLRVGYVLKMYPRFSETFILSEILAHEAAGLDLHIFSLKYPIDGHFHEALARVKAPVTYLANDSLRAVAFWQDIARAGAANPAVWARLPEAAHDDAHDVHAAALLSSHVKARRITHLHAHFATSAATVAVHAAAMSGIGCSFTAHAKDIYIDGLDHERFRRLLRGASSAVTVSDYNLEHLRRTYGEDADNLQRIYNGVDLRLFPYTAPDTRERLVVGVGRLVEKKGFEDLVQACDRLHQRRESFRCEIIGDGPLAARLEFMVRERDLGGVVRLMGPLPREQVIARVQAAAALAAPCVIGSDGNRDGLPTVLLEAMALGTPCVSTDVTGIGEAVRDGETGLCVPQRSPEALAASLQRLLNDAPLRAALASKARRRVEEHFDIERNSGLLRSLFTAGRPAAAEGLGARP